MTNQTNELPHWEMVPLSVASLQSHPLNYREHPDDQLEHIVQSIKEHGIYRGVVVAADRVVLAGHGVLQAAIRLGLQEIPCVLLDVESSDPRAEKLLLGDNEIAKLAKDDDRKKVALLQRIHLRSDLRGTGFDELQLNALRMLTRPPDALSAKNEVDEWVQAGMPEHESGSPGARLIVQFRDTHDRERFVKDHSIVVSKQGMSSWSAWWPPQGPDGEVVKWVGAA